MHKRNCLSFLHHTLSKWILSCCIILLIPIFTIAVNFMYTKSLVTEKINKANTVSLLSLSSNIDKSLASMLSIEQYVSLSSSFLDLSQTGLSLADYEEIEESCLDQLKIYRTIFPSTDIVIYLPYRDRIITSTTANSSYYIYNTLTTLRGMKESQKKWMDALAVTYRGNYLISSTHSYENYGKPSFVYASRSPFVYEEENQYHIYISIPCSSANALLPEDEDSTFLILDKNGTVLAQLGTPLPNILSLPIEEFDSADHVSSYTIGDTGYALCYTASSVADWSYVMCTPDSTFMKEAIALRNANLLAVFTVITLGLLAIILLQIRNYRPIKQLLVRLSMNSDERPDGNEFELLEHYYDSLFHENSMIKNTLLSQKDFARQNYLLSKLHNREFHLSEADVKDFLNLSYDGSSQNYALISIYLGNGSSEVAEHFDLFSFAVSNVMEEILGKEYRWQKTTDQMFLVYLFLLPQELSVHWESDCTQKLQKVYDFFRDSFHMELSILIGSLFEDFENIAANYAELLDGFEYHYVLEQSGIISLNSLKNIDLSTLPNAPQPLTSKEAACSEIADTPLLITRIQDYVEANYMDSEMNISSIASAMNLTPKYMSRLFKEATDEGLLSYINTTRIQHSITLLTDTTDTIDEIAQKSGFTNSRSYRRNFTKATGKSPTDYRK